MITLTKSGNAIVFTFDDNDHYLNDGKIEVPVNSLTLVTDDSQMATFRKAASNDIFISATYDELGMSKADLESWFKENAFDTGGVTEEWVEEYVSESISGKADTSDVQEIASDVSTVSGDVNTLSGSVNALTGAVNTLSGDVSTLSGAVDSNHNAITALNGDIQTLSGQVQGDETILTGHTANTDIHVTASDKQNWNNKSDFSGSYNDLTDKPTIPVVPTNVSAFNNDAGYATSGYVDSSVSGKVNTTDFNTYSASTDARLAEDEEVTSAALNSLNDALDDKADTTAVTASIAAAISGKQDTLVSGTNIKTINNESLLGSGNIDIQGGSSINVVQTTGTSTGDVMSQSAVSQSLNNKYDRLSLAVVQDEHQQLDGRTDLYATKGSTQDLIFEASSINGKQVLNKSGSASNKFDLVETSAITSSVTSSSTDSQVPSAKAVYDALQEGGGNNVIELTQAQYDALTDVDPDAFYIITDADGGATTGQVQTMIDDSISGKADTSAVTEAVSSKMDTSSFNTYSASTDNRLSEDEEVTAAALNSLNDALSDKADTSAVTESINAAVSGKADTSAFTAHTADTTIHTTSAEKTSWNGAVTALGGLKLVSLTQAQYDSLATKDASTLYIITGSN